MKLAIIGSRTFTDYSLVKEKVLKIGKENISLIISGGARGADSFGEQVAKELGIETLIFPAEWKKYGRRAGFIRNQYIIDNCDRVLAFWDGESHGTKHSIGIAEQQNKLVEIVYFKNKE